MILETRDRPGGRIHTIHDEAGKLPIELGAEFVHGRRNRSWKFIRAALLQTREVPDRHWIAEQGTLSEEKKFWDELSTVTRDIDSFDGDIDSESYLARISAPDKSKWLMREYVEGFHAAPVGRMSINALVKSEDASEKADGTRQFRLSLGYSALVEWLVRKSKAVQILYQTMVRSIRWEPGSVEVEAQDTSGVRHFNSSKVLVTVPLGVLKEGRLEFKPLLIEKQKAIDALEVGEVIKLTLKFHRRFWPIENFGFIHSADKWLPTWWSGEGGSVLIGWAGGSRAKVLNCENQAVILERAIRALSLNFRVEPRGIRDLLAEVYFHNWSNDPFARGAYSFTPPGMMLMPDLLGEPVAGTIFFAGEATDGKGAQGTVHGAIASGERAAREMLKKIRRPVVRET
jgi:monoamine oxidase